MKKLYIHIGYPKAASTFLQKEIFPNLKDVYYIVDEENNHRKYNLIKKI